MENGRASDAIRTAWPIPNSRPLDGPLSRRSTVMRALSRATVIITEYQRDSSSKRLRSFVVSAAARRAHGWATGRRHKRGDHRGRSASRTVDVSTDIGVLTRGHSISASWRTASDPAHAPGGLSKLPPWNPPVPRGRATLPEPHPPDADQGGPDRARERRGPRCIRSVRRGPRAGLPARRFGGVPPPSSPCSRRARSGGWLARTVVPSAPGAGLDCTRSERRLRRRGGRRPRPDLGTAVRPPSRGREGRRPRDGRRTPALATAHPAGLKSGPARRVRLSQIPASRTAQAKSDRRR